jgi:hypothetical protein
MGKIVISWELYHLVKQPNAMNAPRRATGTMRVVLLPDLAKFSAEADSVLVALTGLWWIPIDYCQQGNLQGSGWRQRCETCCA